MRRFVLISCVSLFIACAPQRQGTYLFVWAGDGDNKANDFLGVIDAEASSPTYGTIVASVATDASGTHPHHTEHELAPNRHLLANGFGAGRTWLFDLTQPLRPKVVTSFANVAGFSHPHSFIRTGEDQVIATFQYLADEAAAPPSHGGGAEHHTPATAAAHRTGGIVLMDERGNVVRSGAAADPAISDKQIFPYGVLPIPAFDRAISTTTDMDEKNLKATSEWIQIWRLSDLKVLKTFALKPGPRGDEHKWTGETRLLPDGKSAYIHTFKCGLYLLTGLDQPQPTATFVRSFKGENCGVPVLTGQYWLQPVPQDHSLVALDIREPQYPREVSTVKFGDDEEPHWIAIDSTGRRIVLNSGGYSKSNRLFIVNFDPGTGMLSMDEKFRDAGSTRAGIDLTGKLWPHGFSGKAAPHGTVFSR